MIIQKLINKYSISGKRSRILPIAWFDPLGVPSIYETIYYFQKNLDFAVKVLNLFDNRYPNNYLSINPRIDLQEYDILIIHNTVSYNVKNLNSLDKFLKIKISDFEGVKVLFKQDDHNDYPEVINYIKKIKFDLIYTLVPKESISKVYPKDQPNGAKVISCLATYVTPYLLNQSKINIKKYHVRGIDIGYRGSVMPLHFGKLCYEKIYW